MFKAPVRLAIMIYLLPRGEAYFSDMVEVLDVTPGNLWSHIEKLELEGYVKLRRVISDRPSVKIVLTDKGFRETIGYVKKIHDIINDLIFPQTHSTLFEKPKC